jgi:hypothetical protein
MGIFSGAHVVRYRFDHEDTSAGHKTTPKDHEMVENEESSGNVYEDLVPFAARA